MPETLEPVAAALLPSGRYGREDGAAGVRLRMISGRALVQVMARGRDDDAIANAVREKYGVALPKTPVMARGARGFISVGRISRLDRNGG